MQLTQFALQKHDLVIDEFWPKISDTIQTIEVGTESLLLQMLTVLVQVEVSFDLILTSCLGVLLARLLRRILKVRHQEDRFRGGGGHRGPGEET